MKKKNFIRRAVAALSALAVCAGAAAYDIPVCQQYHHSHRNFKQYPRQGRYQPQRWKKCALRSEC